MVKKLLYLHLFVLAVLWTIAFIADGTGGGGDSIVHYFISKFAWRDARFLFDQWGKPFFTLVSSPFAQFGFTGIKLFNIFCGVASAFLACLTAIQLGKKMSWLIILFAFATPAFYSYLFSGLTEPFSALITISAVYLCIKGNVGWGFVMASFLGFCRTEAQVFLLFFLIFGILNGHGKKLPLLITGYILYSIAGGLYMDNYSWIFSSPYDSGASIYGKGSWLHYADRLFMMLALPSFTLLVLGLLQFLRRAFILKNINWKTEPWLVHAIFGSLLFGHTLVWALGIFASAGLERTLIIIFPLMWIIMLDGVQLLMDIWQKYFKSAALLPIIYVVIHLVLFFTNKFTPYYWSGLFLSAEDKFVQNTLAPYIEKNHPDTERFAVDNPFLALTLDINFFNTERVYWADYNRMPEMDSSILWLYDYRYVPMQYGINLEQIRKESKLEVIKSFEGPDNSQFVVLKKK